MAADPEPARDPKPLLISPLVVWLVVQLAALVVSASRLPLSARFPQPGERLAAHVMVAVQVTGAALLFPILLRDARATVTAILTLLPFLQLAGYLAGTPASRIASASAYVSAWLVALALWRGALRSDRAKLCGVAVAGAMVLVGPIAWYARAEFARRASDPDWARDGMLGPVMGALAQLGQPAPSAGPWLVIVALVALCGAVVLLRRAMRRTHGSG